MRALIAAPFLLLAGCVVIPAGPSVRVLPGPNKPFDVFVRDDAYCRQFAAQQTGIAPTTLRDFDCPGPSRPPPPRPNTPASASDATRTMTPPTSPAACSRAA